MAWTTFMDVHLVEVTGRPGAGPPPAGLLQRCRGLVLRPDRDPLAALDLLERLGGRPEVVVLDVELQVAAERGVRALLVQRVAHLALVGAARLGDTGGEDLPRVPRRRGLGLEGRVRQLGVLRALGE